jgi:hypothetical protein
VKTRIISIISILTLIILASALPAFAAKKSNGPEMPVIQEEDTLFICYKKVNGQMRIVHDPAECRPSEESMPWIGQASIDNTTYEILCENTDTCSCSEGGLVIQNYAACPEGSVLAASGAAAGSAYATCVTLDANLSVVAPAAISISCAGTPPPPTDPELICNDGIDDDLDGLTDCADSDCFSDAACLPPPTIDTEIICSDGTDDDLDGLTDCADPDCAADPFCSPSIEICTGGMDEDGDGDIDCADADCTSDPACLTQSLGMECKGKGCNPKGPKNK